MSDFGAPTNGLNILQLASKRMDWLADRQKLIASNIANADTKGYQPKDVNSFEDFLTLGEIREESATTAWDSSPDGNRVVLEEQMLLSDETESAHRLATRLYRKTHDLISLAVTK